MRSCIRAVEMENFLHLDVAVCPPEPRLAVRRAHDERAAAVLDCLLVPPELGVAGGAVAEQHGVASLPVQALGVRGARLGELGSLEEVVAAEPRRRRCLSRRCTFATSRLLGSSWHAVCAVATASSNLL
jgi:hypothetical protein